MWPILVVTGIERLHLRGDADPFLRIDFTAAIAWALLFGAVYRVRTGNGFNAIQLAGGSSVTGYST